MNRINNNKLIPELRFPEFQEDWKLFEIQDIAKVKTGNKDTQNKIKNGKYPFFVRSQTPERINSYSYKGEAILTSGDGVGVGKNFHYIVGKFDFHQRVYCIHDFSTSVLGHFVFQYFSEHFYRRVMQLSAKNSVDSIRMAMITEMPISLPCIEEQKKISDCLASIDALIAAHTKKINALKAYREGLMQQLFPAKGETIPKIRFAEFSGAGDWDKSTFSELFEIGGGKDHKHLPDGDIPVYGSGGYMRSVDSFLYDGESACIGRKGTINKPMFLEGKFWTVDTLFYTHSFKKCSAKFVYLLFQKVNWLRLNEAGGVPSLSKVIINKVEVRVPSLDEQNEIVNTIWSIDKYITEQVKKAQSLRVHKKGLMQKLFPAVIKEHHL